MSFRIRTADLSDAATVIGIWRCCDLIRPWNDPEEDLRRSLECESSAVLIGEEDRQALATAMVGFDGHRGWIYYLGVLPSRRRSGFGRRMLDACCDWLRERDCPKAELMVRDGNPAAELYERLDWELQPVRTYARWLGKR